MPIHLVENSVVAGRFRLNKMIGRGGMGSVWLATHLGLDIPCAVKFMEGEFSHSAEAHARFEREAKAAAQLRSPHVVQVLDHGVCEGTPYIAMELLDGEDLGKRLQKSGTIHPRDLNMVINQVCRALTKAHAVGIVHRDLKPDNIFLVRDDDREIAKVLDFGIAKSAASALEGSNTKTGAMLGTPYYMSPEQAQGVKSVDYRSDLWSLAVIVYQCVTGYLPFDSEALGDLLMKIMVQPLPVPSQVAQVPPGFDAWWARAASRDPAGRFQTAKEFTESLQLVFGISQGPDVRLGQTPNPAGQMPMGMPGMHGGTGAGLIHGGTGGVPAGTLSTTTGAQIARTFDGQGPAGVPQKKTGLIVAIAAVVIFIMTCVGAFVMIKKAPASAPAAALPEAAQPQAASPPPAVSAAAKPPAPVVSVVAAVAVTGPTAAPTPAPAVAAEEAPRTSHHGDHGGKSPQAVAPPARPQAAEPKPAEPKPAASPKAGGGDLGF